MTLEEAQRAFDLIQKAADEGDDERAHFYEDHLHIAVLHHVAERPTSRANGELAKWALRAESLRFARWCA